jgi:hypothetical protein
VRLGYEARRQCQNLQTHCSLPFFVIFCLPDAACCALGGPSGGPARSQPCGDYPSVSGTLLPTAEVQTSV